MFPNLHKHVCCFTLQLIRTLEQLRAAFIAAYLKESSEAHWLNSSVTSSQEKTHVWPPPLHQVEFPRPQSSRANGASVRREGAVDVATVSRLAHLSDLLEVLVEEPLGVGDGSKASFLVPCGHDTRTHTRRLHDCSVGRLQRQPWKHLDAWCCDIRRFTAGIILLSFVLFIVVITFQYSWVQFNAESMSSNTPSAQLGYLPTILSN